jgi:hypothetical protein
MKADGGLGGAVVTRPVGRSDHRNETNQQKIL